VFYNNCALFGATLFYVTSKEFRVSLIYHPSRKIEEGKDLNIRKFVKSPIIVFTVVPCILILSKFFIYRLIHNRAALKEY